MSDEQVIAKERATERMVQAYPKLAEFFSKYALGPKAPPSCFVCGHAINGLGDIGVSHLELPGIVCCARCKKAVEAARAGCVDMKPEGVA